MGKFPSLKENSKRIINREPRDSKMKDKTQAGDRQARKSCFLPYHEHQRVARPQLAGRRKTWMLHSEGGLQMLEKVVLFAGVEGLR